MIRYILLSLIVLARSNWVLKSYEGYDNQFQNWVGGETKTCETSPRAILYVDSELTEKTFQIDLTHIGTIVMVVIETINDGSEMTIQINNRKQNQRDYNIIHSECLSSLSSQNKQVIYIDMTQEAEEKINLSLQSQAQFALTQVHIFVQECQDGCLQCLINENYSELCLVCEEGYINQSNGTCLCQDYKFGEQCLKQCPVGTVPDNQQGCLKGEMALIERKLNVFPNPFVKSIIINGRTIAGIFEINQELKIQFDIADLTQQYYFEADLFFFQFTNFTEFQMEIENADLLNIFIVEKIYTQPHSQVKNCDFAENCQVIKLRTKNTKFDKKTIELIMSSKAMSNLYTQNIAQNLILNWGIKNLELKLISFAQDNCQIENCGNCLKDYYECSQCEQNYVLFENRCLTKCPPHSILKNNVCIEYSQEIPFTKYLVKQYYEPQFHYYNKQFGELSLQGSNQLNDHLIEGVTTFGGFWNMDEFSKIFYLDPHYALTLKMKIRFIDFQSSTSIFMYQIDGGEEQYVLPIRNSNNEGIGYIDSYFLHNDNDIQFTFGCKAQGYCYISDYFFLIHKCHPYCLSCTGPNMNDCSKFQNELISFNSQTLSCNSGYYLSKESTCNQCMQGCIQCTSELACLECSSEYQINKRNECKRAKM